MEAGSTGKEVAIRTGRPTMYFVESTFARVHGENGRWPAVTTPPHLIGPASIAENSAYTGKWLLTVSASAWFSSKYRG